MTVAIRSVMVSHPFMFLQPYGLQGDHNLQGRDDEAASLLALLKWKDIIVVFGKSGVGKTSFINHTLSVNINRANWLPIRVTRLLNINESIKRSIRTALRATSVKDIHSESISVNSFDHNAGQETEDTVTLMEQLYLKWNRPVYLIIDQLEELFLIGDKNEQREFLDTLQGLMNSTIVQKKVILVLREEHLGYIQEIECILNGVFQDALPIKEIKQSDGVKVYESLLDSPLLQQDTPGLVFKTKASSGEVKELMVESCSQGDTFAAQKIQILLFLLWENWQKIYSGQENGDDKDLFFYAQQLCQSPNPLKDYLQTTVDESLAEKARLLRAPYWFILRNSISQANTKKPVSLTDLYKALAFELAASYGISVQGNQNPHELIGNEFQISKPELDKWCSSLAEKRILQKIDDDNAGDEYYQLRHDILVADIKQLDPRLPLRFPRRATREDQHKNPYQGLEQYGPPDEGRSGRFRRGQGQSKRSQSIPKLYGRESIVQEYAEFLKSDEKCLVVVGDSGTGKSSLVKGGLLPAMQQADFETKTLQPGPDLEAFKAKIEEFIRGTVSGSNDHPQTKKCCLYIDQFEECYTFRDSSLEQRDQFCSFLTFLQRKIEDKSNNFKLIVSIRHDYAHEFDRNITDWRRYKKLLRYPTLDEIFDIVVGPAYDKGVKFKPANLPERIAADAENTSYFLPLLSFTMQTLYREEVVKRSDKNDKGEVCLTEEGYNGTGKIVECLQQEFTKVFRDLPDDQKEIFPQLMARMIVIKDTIPKAQPLAISRINYLQPEKTDKALEILNKFTPEFFRVRTISINETREDCYEPIHDSLLIYCDEIRDVVKTVHDPESQMSLQPRLESILVEWERALHGSGGEKDVESIGLSGHKRMSILEKRYKEMEPLYCFLDKGADDLTSWLFADEVALVSECKRFSDSLQDTEKLVTANRVRELEIQHQQQELREKKLAAEHELVLAEARKKEHELFVKTVMIESKATKAKLKSSRWLMLLILAVTIAIITVIISINDSNVKDAVITEQISNTRELSRLYSDLQKQADLIKVTNDSLMFSKAQTDSLNERLIINQSELQKAVASLSIAQRKLIREVHQKDSAIATSNSINQNLLMTNAILKAEKDRVDSLKNVRILTLAELNRTSSPALSYRLAEQALRSSVSDLAAAKLMYTLNSKHQYFESLIRNNVTLVKISGDGSKILTVEPDPFSVDKNIVWFWNDDGKQVGQPLKIGQRVTTAELSYDGTKALIATDNSINIFDLADSRRGNEVIVQGLLYTRFAEQGNRVFAISMNNIIVYDTFGNTLMETFALPFESDAKINNARLSGHLLTVITPKGIGRLDIRSDRRMSFVSLPQSFILNDGVHVLAMQKSFFTSDRKLVFFDGSRAAKWKFQVGEKNYNLITSFTNSDDGRYAIVKFNRREDIIQYTQQLQKQFFINAPSLEPSGNVNDPPDDLYYLDFKDQKIFPIYNEKLVNGRFIISVDNDSIFEFNTGSIIKYPIVRTASRSKSARGAVSISQNTSFKQVLLAGTDRRLIASLDVNNQFKLWRYGKANELERNEQLWIPSKEEFDEILAID